MDISSIFSDNIFRYLIIPVLIFMARIMDVSIGTMRVIFVSRGFKLFAAFCGFFEVLIWIIAITQIIKNLNNPLYYIAYAGGFATGNYIGMVLEEKIALGTVLLRIVIPHEIPELEKYLRESKYGLTVLEAKGLYNEVKILFTVLPRKEVDKVLCYIEKINPNVFYTVEDIRYFNKKTDSMSRDPKMSRGFLQSLLRILNP
jgi:uncharacterized protein YebE (UPF0316 family)